MKKKNLTSLIFAGCIGSSSAAGFALNFGDDITAPGNQTTSSLGQSTFSNVDFDGNGSGDVWNHIAALAANTTIGNGTRGTIQDFTGAATAHTLRINGFSGFQNNDSNAPTTAQWGNALGVEHSNMTGGILSSLYFSSGTPTLTFGGFAANETDLRVEIFAALDIAGASTSYSIGGDSQSIVQDAFFTSGDPTDARAVFDGVTADASGNVVININGGASPVAAVRISPIPEPSSTALLGLGGLALILRRKK